MLDILLKSSERLKNLARFYWEYRSTVDIFYRFIGDIDIGNGIQALDNNFWGGYPKIGRKEKDIKTWDDKKCSNEEKRKPKAIFVLIQNIDDGIKIIKSFFFSKKSEERRMSFGGFSRIKKIALFFLQRGFFSKFSIFPVSSNSLNTVSKASREVHIVWIVH